ncbi:uncharacterized protein RCC_08792 [Ramularia collo-cygni]|uniref:F-box domain-containing protein n=1 Tax=Ramularia collo-cygni TaxID=112498 RepID=A0A2D3VDF6_9PEZI|nr:uncharacterized protein RCC_08792 [Ramularia collo-cygni]CZT23082.1 uncharacterized protein RCC_08792 [Ramularia collo-cygni]
MSTLNSPGSPACDKVLDVGELVENIVRFLPVKDITRAMRLSKFFHATITNSPEAQRIRFLRHVPWTGPVLKNRWKRKRPKSAKQDEDKIQWVDLNPLLLAGGVVKSPRGGVWGVHISFHAISQPNMGDYSSKMAITRPHVPGVRLFMLPPALLKMIDGDDKQVTLGDLQVAEAGAQKEWKMLDDKWKKHGEKCLVRNGATKKNDGGETCFDVLWRVDFPLWRALEA